MADEKYLMGTKVPVWRESNVKNITFVVTEDCNLVCKYCYITGKNTKNKMSFETAKKAVDYILSHQDEFPEESVIWEFIGGEPFLEIELIDKISDYIKTEMYRLQHRWFNNFRFNFSTNGLLYGTPQVQQYIAKNRHNLSVGISVDGNKLKHDQQRIKPDGTGSFDEIMQNVPLWLEQFPVASTKATFASADLYLLKDSVIALYEMGITNIPANVVFENDWQEGDDLIFEQQLRDLADYIIDNKLWNKFNCTFFAETIGSTLNEEDRKKNWCGAGKMLAIDYQGKFYPCIRFVGYSLNHREGYVVGDVENGYDIDKLRPFAVLNLEKQSSDECLQCQVATGCAWCQGFNYDTASIDTIYERATYICKMHKARVRANDYYWARLKEASGMERKVPVYRKNHLYFLLSTEAARHCTYDPSKAPKQEMPFEIFKQGLNFALQNFYNPVLLLSPEGLSAEQKALLRGVEVTEVYSSNHPVQAQDGIAVYDNHIQNLCDGDNALLLLKKESIPGLSNTLKTIFTRQSRINLVLEDVEKITDTDLQVYEQELENIAEYLTRKLGEGSYLELNVLSDPLVLSTMANCNAGVESFMLAPNGNFYICPAFYYADPEQAIGNLEDGITFSYQKFLRLEKSPVCSVCDAHHCRRCVYQNKQLTREYLIPGKNQCVVSHVERKVGKKYALMLAENGYLEQLTLRTVEEIFPELDYIDPVQHIVAATKVG